MRTALLLSVMVLLQAASGQDRSYFPAATKPGEDGVSKLEAKWFGTSLQRMNEPHLAPLAVEPDAEVYRILILPTWGNSIAVRVQKHGAIYRLTARRLSGHAGYDPGRLAESRDVELTAADSRTLDVLVQDLAFFQIATDDDVRGSDGDEWVLEGVSKGKYHVVDRWCATEYDPDKRKLRPFLALVKFLLDKSTLSQRPSDKGRRLM
ncbi:MAG TPA: hypothetical protein VMH04_02555 [Candidatus Solibacter sp.]|nr:hypothetical protein [Candidatus Solibacter sp.]